MGLHYIAARDYILAAKEFIPNPQLANSCKEENLPQEMFVDFSFV